MQLGYVFNLLILIGITLVVIGVTDIPENSVKFLLMEFIFYLVLCKISESCHGVLWIKDVNQSYILKNM